MTERIRFAIEEARRDPVRVAQDPDTDPFVLTLLANEFAEEVSRNPSWRLALLDGGRFFDTILNARSPKGAKNLIWQKFVSHLVRLLRTDALGPQLASYLVNHPRVEGSALALTCSALPRPLARQAWRRMEADLETAIRTMSFWAQPSGGTSRHLAQHYPPANMTADLQCDPLRPRHLIDMDWLRLGLGHEKLYLHWAERALRDANAATLAANIDLTFTWPNLTPRVARAFLDTILDEGFRGPRGPAATTKHAVINLLRLLLRSPNLPADVLTQVGERVQHGSWFRFEKYATARDDLLHLVAQHPNTPERLLRDLAEEVPKYVLENPNLPESWGLPLARDHEDDLRYPRIVPNMPTWLVEWVGARVLPRAPFLSPRATSRHSVQALREEDRTMLARRSGVRENVSFELAHDSNVMTRKALASTTRYVRVQMVLMKDEDRTVRQDLTRNAFVSLRVLAHLNAEHHGTALGAMASAALARKLPIAFVLPT